MVDDAEQIDRLAYLVEVVPVELLTELTHHRRPGVRRRSYLALAAIEHDSIPALLEQGLRDSDRTVRGAAALALGDLEASQSLDTLFLAFERGVVESAIAIGKIGGADSVARFDEFLGRQPLGVMLSGYEHYLRRDAIPIATKRQIVERLGEVASRMVKRFLLEYLGTFPTRRDRNRERVALRELVEQTANRISDNPQPRTPAASPEAAPEATPAAAAEGGAS
jgi:HEAT repeat protein